MSKVLLALKQQKGRWDQEIQEKLSYPICSSRVHWLPSAVVPPDSWVTGAVSGHTRSRPGGGATPSHTCTLVWLPGRLWFYPEAAVLAVTLAYMVVLGFAINLI